VNKVKQPLIQIDALTTSSVHHEIKSSKLTILLALNIFACALGLSCLIAMIALDGSLGVILASAMVMLLTGTQTILLVTQYRRNLAEQQVYTLHYQTRKAGIYNQLKSRNNLKVEPYLYGSMQTPDGCIAIQYGFALCPETSERLLVIITSRSKNGSLDLDVNVQSTRFVDILLNAQDATHPANWKVIRQGVIGTWMESVRGLPEPLIPKMYTSMDARSIQELISHPKCQYEVQCSLVEQRYGALDHASKVDNDMLRRWCNAHLPRSNKGEPYPNADELIPFLGERMEAIRGELSAKLPPMSLTVPLGEYALICREEEPLRQFCLMLASAVGMTRNPESSPQRQNTWIFQKVHSHRVMQGPLLPIIKAILKRYELIEYGDDDEVIKGYQYVYGTEAALERFPGAKRLLLAQDLGV
jgi:hypothetical protein